jgi:hypothetical protein
VRGSRKCRLGSNAAGLALAAATIALSFPVEADPLTTLGEGFDIDRLVPTPAGDRFTFVPETRIRDEACTESPCWFALSAFSSYASGGVRLKRFGSESTKSSDVVRMHLGASWAPQEWWQWSLDVPLNIYQTDLSEPVDGYVVSPTSRLGRKPETLDVGDLRVGLRVPLTLRRRPSWAMQGYAFLPTGDYEHLTGDRYFRFDVLALAGFGSHDDSPVVGAAYLGLGLHPFDPRFAGILRAEGKVGGALSFYLLSLVQLTVEARVDPRLEGPSPADASAGVRLRPMPEAPWWLSLLGTKGLSSAPGVPVAAVSLAFTLVPQVD